MTNPKVATARDDAKTRGPRARAREGELVRTRRAIERRAMMMTTTTATRATTVTRSVTTARNPRRIGRCARARILARAQERAETVETVDDVALDMEPCLVGWNDTDESGEPVYCCEEPGGGTRCVSAGEKVECAVVEDENGELTVDCSTIKRKHD